MTINEIIDILESEHDVKITREEDQHYYSVHIYDAGEGCYQDLELTEDELISLYDEYFA